MNSLSFRVFPIIVSKIYFLQFQHIYKSMGGSEIIYSFDFAKLQNSQKQTGNPQLKLQIQQSNVKEVFGSGQWGLVDWWGLYIAVTWNDCTEMTSLTARCGRPGLLVSIVVTPREHITPARIVLLVDLSQQYGVVTTLLLAIIRKQLLFDS